MLYKTRHLEAIAELSHGDRHVLPAERFHASEIDADYYLSKKMAREVPAEPVAPEPFVPEPKKPAAKTTNRTPDRLAEVAVPETTQPAVSTPETPATPRRARFSPGEPAVRDGADSIPVADA